MSIRLRLAAVFVLGAAVLFSLGAWLFVTQLSSGLLGLLDTQLRVNLSQAGRLVTQPASGVRVVLPGQFILQVFDASGRLRGSTPDSGDTPLLSAAQLRQARRASIVATTTVDEGPERIVASPYPAHAGWVAAAGTSLETFDRTLSDVERALVAGGIAVLLIAGGGAYGLARAALSPVERLRREVAAVSDHGRNAAVAVPSTHDELAALATTMNELLARLHEALARQRAFVADASHELRTPFAVLQAELELASRPGREREELTAALSRASEEAGRLTRLANDLLLLAGSDELQLEARRRDVNVESLLTDSARTFAGRAAAAGVGCRLEVEGTLVGHLDPDRIRQAVDNLLDNALRFAPAGSDVVLAAGAHEADLVIAVSDEGPGFPLEYLPRAFERFSRPDSGRARSDGGTGLGLAIAQAIAVAHGGQASAQNRPAGGATVSLELPGALRPA